MGICKNKHQTEFATEHQRSIRLKTVGEWCHTDAQCLEGECRGGDSSDGCHNRLDNLYCSDDLTNSPKTNFTSSNRYRVNHTAVVDDWFDDGLSFCVNQPHGLAHFMPNNCPEITGSIGTYRSGSKYCQTDKVENLLDDSYWNKLKHD